MALVVDLERLVMKIGLNICFLCKEWEILDYVMQDDILF